MTKLSNKFNVSYSYMADLFAAARTWTQLQALYTLFVGGVIEYTPTYQETMTPDVDTLHIEQVIRAGCITVDSQPGECEKDQIQRAYVDGYINLAETDVETFVATLGKYSDKFMYTITFENGKILTNEDSRHWTVKPAVYATDENNSRLLASKRKPEGHVLYKDSSKLFMPVTAYFSDVTNLYHIFSKRELHLAGHDSMAAWWHIVRNSSVVDIDVASVNITSTDFCRDGVLDVLLEALKSAPRTPPPGSLYDSLGSIFGSMGL